MISRRLRYRPLPGQRRQRHHQRPLLLERVEDRVLLATITVNTVADVTSDLTLTLRQAIEVNDGTLPISSLTSAQQTR